MHIYYSRAEHILFAFSFYNVSLCILRHSESITIATSIISILLDEFYLLNCFKHTEDKFMGVECSAYLGTYMSWLNI